MLENNSKVASGHPDHGYSIWLEFVCLAPSISVYLKFGSLSQPQERHLFLLTKVQWEGKGHSKVAESAYPVRHQKAWCRALGLTENMGQVWFPSLWSEAVVGKRQRFSETVFSETIPSSGIALITKNISACWMALIGFFFSWFLGSRILVSLSVSHLALRNVRINGLGFQKG